MVESRDPYSEFQTRERIAEGVKEIIAHLEKSKRNPTKILETLKKLLDKLPPDGGSLDDYWLKSKADETTTGAILLRLDQLWHCAELPYAACGSSTDKSPKEIRAEKVPKKKRSRQENSEDDDDDDINDGHHDPGLSTPNDFDVNVFPAFSDDIAHKHEGALTPGKPPLVRPDSTLDASRDRHHDAFVADFSNLCHHQDQVLERHFPVKRAFERQEPYWVELPAEINDPFTVASQNFIDEQVPVAQMLPENEPLAATVAIVYQNQVLASENTRLKEESEKLSRDNVRLQDEKEALISENEQLKSLFSALNRDEWIQ